MTNRTGFSTGLYGSYVYSYNYLSNANFRFWDRTIIRVTPGSIARDWSLLTLGSARRQEDGPDDRTKFCVEVQSEPGDDVEFGQFITAEDASCMSGQWVTLQFYQKYIASVNPIRARLYSVAEFNNQFSDMTLVAQGAAAITGGSWVYQEMSFDLTTADLTNGLWVIWEVEADNSIFRLSRPQINVGDRATPFEFKPYADELRPDDAVAGMCKYVVTIVGGESQIDMNPYMGADEVDQVNVLMSGAILQETYDYTWEPDTKIITFLSGYRPRAEDTCVVQGYTKTGSGVVAGVRAFNTRTGFVVPEASDYDAWMVDFDPANSKMTTTDVQAAIDELASSVGYAGDVDITTTPPEVGEALVWDGANFVPGSVGGFAVSVFRDDYDYAAAETVEYDDGTGRAIWRFSTPHPAGAWVGIDAYKITPSADDAGNFYTSIGDGVTDGSNPAGSWGVLSWADNSYKVGSIDQTYDVTCEIILDGGGEWTQRFELHVTQRYGEAPDFQMKGSFDNDGYYPDAYFHTIEMGVSPSGTNRLAMNMECRFSSRKMTITAVLRTGGLGSLPDIALSQGDLASADVTRSYAAERWGDVLSGELRQSTTNKIPAGWARIDGAKILDAYTALGLTQTAFYSACTAMTAADYDNSATHLYGEYANASNAYVTIAVDDAVIIPDAWKLFDRDTTDNTHIGSGASDTSLTIADGLMIGNALVRSTSIVVVSGTLASIVLYGTTTDDAEHEVATLPAQTTAGEHNFTLTRNMSNQLTDGGYKRFRLAFNTVGSAENLVVEQIKITTCTTSARKMIADSAIWQTFVWGLIKL